MLLLTSLKHLRIQQIPKQYLKNMLNRDAELAKGWVQIEHSLLIDTVGGKQKDQLRQYRRYFPHYSINTFAQG